MKIIVNPGSKTESRAITVTEKFPVNREDHVRADVWLPQLIGNNESQYNYPIIIAL